MNPHAVSSSTARTNPKQESLLDNVGSAPAAQNRGGLSIERVFTTPHTDKCTWDETLNNIRQVGPESTICATDLGQTTNPGLQEGFEIFIGKMLDDGWKEADIKRMTQHNAAALLGAE